LITFSERVRLPPKARLKGKQAGFRHCAGPTPTLSPMTTLIAFQGPDFAILGADSQITDGDKRIISPSIPKVVKLGKYLVGVAGDVRPGDLLAFNWKPPAYDGTDPVKFMGRKIVPSIIATFRDGGYDYAKEGASYSYLIAFAGNVFEIGDDLSISQSQDGLYAVGSGGAYALGYLAGTIDNLTQSEWAQDEIIEALKIAAKYDVNTSAPFQIEIQPA
jgi:ATP-dependent protease HslVU (ClpYQ) peptidase subunit